MLTLIVKLILLLFGIFMFDNDSSAAVSVTGFLTAAILSSLNQYFESKRFTVAGSAVYCAVSVAFPSFSPFVPLFCFDLFMSGQRLTALFTLIPCVSYIIQENSALLILLMALAVLTQYMCERLIFLSEENRRIRDTGVELNRTLAQKNEILTEKYNYEIHLAALKERTRIAREIHDNVGHILSRSILQTGALQAVNKDELTAEHITALKDTLSLAMDSIRNSVHGLRDDSIDLHNSIHKMTEHLNYKTEINYDITQDLSNDLKYCFLAILKESLTNIAKHSDATLVRITVREHPAMYQMLVHDNGTKKNNPDGRGMGLYNMEERVSAFSGRFSATYQNGFRIFISIPKQEDTNEHNNS